MAHHRHGHHLHNDHAGNPVPAPTPAPTPDPAPTPAPDPAPAAPDFTVLGATFNDATRALEGGLWQNAVEEGAQGNGSVFRYVNDLTIVQNGLQAGIAANQFAGDTVTHVNTILNDITTAVSAATASTSGGGTFGNVTAAETALRNNHLDILNIVNNDANLTALATANGATGFMAVPATLPDGVTAATAPHGNLAELGAIFNDAANRALGGINPVNAPIISADDNAVISGLQQLIANNTFADGLTGIHADTVMRQLHLENTYIQQALNGVPDAGRGSNDNFLDMIDIIQGDTNLANMATTGGVVSSQGVISGFANFPDALNPTPRFQDNDAQTTFWATFIAQGNALGDQANQLVGSGNTDAINNLITQLQTFAKDTTNFDLAQGGIFEARFDNELTPNSTLGAEVDAMIRGLTTGNKALVAAAAEVIHANAADVSGNNIPVTGGTFNPDGRTVADALSTATPAPAAVAAAAPAAAAATPATAATTTTAAASTAASTGASSTSSTIASASSADDAVGAGDHQHHCDVSQISHHFEHLWG